MAREVDDMAYENEIARLHEAIESADAVVVGAVSCLKDSPLAVYERPGEWMAVTHKIPVAQLPGGKLTRFETGLFNDGNGYVADPPDGNNWNNDTGVKMTVRDMAVYTDRPE